MWNEGILEKYFKMKDLDITNHSKRTSHATSKKTHFSWT